MVSKKELRSRNIKAELRREIEETLGLLLDKKKAESVEAFLRERDELKAILHFADGRKSITFKHQG